MTSHAKYKVLLAKTDTITDGLGTPIDKEIKPVVAALWLHGFTTTGSCAGHIDSKSGGPYIHITSDDFISQYEQFDEIMKSGDMVKARQLKQQIYDASLDTYSRLFDLLCEFYQDTIPDYDNLLVTYAQLNGEIYLYMNSARMADALTPNERSVWLQKCHSELQRFTDFLLAEYFK